jgi:hypothetical protein
MNKILFSLVILGSLVSVNAFAQENGQKDDDSDKKISGTDYSYYKRGRDGKGNSEDVRPEANVVKMGLTRWLSGVIPFYYERRVAPFVSLQFGLGLTTRDFIYDGITELSYALGSTPGVYNNYGFYQTQGRKASVGVYASFQPKFYPKSRALTNFFVSPMVEFKRFDYKAQLANNLSINGNDEPTYQSNYMWEYRNCVDFTVNVGRQWFLNSGVSLELRGGVGFQKIWEFRRNILQTNPGGNSGYYNSTINFSYYRPEFNLDLNIGGFF